MSTIQATDQTLNQVIKETDKLLLVDFWAPWCGPCRILGPILDELAQQYADELTVAKVNVDTNPVSAIQHHIQGIPTMKVFRNGQEEQTLVGLRSKDQLVQLLGLGG